MMDQLTADDVLILSICILGIILWIWCEVNDPTSQWNR